MIHPIKIILHIPHPHQPKVETNNAMESCSKLSDVKRIMVVMTMVSNVTLLQFMRQEFAKKLWFLTAKFQIRGKGSPSAVVQYR